MTFFLIRFLILFGIIAFIFYFLTIFVVPQNYAFVQERFGKYRKTIRQGMHFQFPFIDKIAYKFSEKEQTEKIESLRCRTADGIEIYIDSIFTFQVQDPFKAAYVSEDYLGSILQEVQRNIIAEIQNHISEELYSRKYGINQSVVKHIVESAKNWGLKIIRFEIQQINREAKIT